MQFRYKLVFSKLYFGARLQCWITTHTLDNTLFKKNSPPLFYTFWLSFKIRY